jgi:ubiquinone/menaquinone biosynthesis C-methylase UbiE
VETSSATPGFAARIASRYDELRSMDDYDVWSDRLAAAGDLDARRVLDIGCGTGAVAIHLARRHGCAVVGVDPSSEMLAVARAKHGRSVRFEQARAEELPFADGSFDRAIMVSVVHHLDALKAFAEVHRVLAPGGRLVISNPDPEGFAAMWLMRWFPELLARELARFPRTHDVLAALQAAGFQELELERVPVDRRFTRAQALAKIRGKHISSFDLLSEDEYRAGLERAERDLPDPVTYTFRTLLVAAVRPHR